MANLRKNRVSAIAVRKDFNSLLPLLRKTISRSLLYLGKNQVEVSIILVPLRSISKLNKIYRGKNKPADVLSFGMPEDFVMPKTKFRPIGEIYLSPEYIKKKKEDIIFLAVHGLLHLLGYDHLKKGDMIEMQRKEQFLMKKLKIN